MYEILTSPIVLVIVFLIFIVGSVVKAILYIKGLHWQIDRVAYRPHFWYGVKGALRSIVMWLIPFGTHSWRNNPIMTILFFLFHLGLIVAPLFLLAHTVILKDAFGIAWPALPNFAADILSWLVIITGVLLVFRRIGMPEVRVLSGPREYLLILLAVAPFITGLAAAAGGSSYSFWLTLHVLTGEIWLVLIPFTRLSHVVLFFCSRAQIGMDFGIKRGGMKNTGMAW